MKKIAYHVMRVFILTMVIITSLAVYRSTIQPDYHWGLLVIEGTGMGGNYINIVALFIWSWLTFLLVTWYRRKWYYLLPIVLTGTCFYYTLKTYLVGDQDMTFNGDALNIHINLGFVMLLITLIALLAALLWSYNDYKKPNNIRINSVSKKVKVLIIISVLLTPVILFAFSFGDGRNHINADRIAVILTILQGLLFYHLSNISIKK